MSTIIFKPFSNKISQFSKVNDLETNSYFICSKQTVSNSYTTYKINFNNLITSYVNYMSDMINNKNLSVFNPIGNWKFSRSIYIENENNSNTSSDITSEDYLSAHKYDALNFEFCETHFLSQLTDLSSKYFGYKDNDNVWHQRLPSYIGMVVINDEFRTEDDVKSIYGTNTEWTQWCGRFILGNGANEEENNTNNYGKLQSGEVRENLIKTLGGTDKIQAEDLKIPKHSHRFKKGSFGQEPNFGKFPEYRILSSDIRIKTEDSFDTYFPDFTDLRLIPWFDTDTKGEFDGGFATLLADNKHYADLKFSNAEAKLKEILPFKRDLDLQTYGSKDETISLTSFKPEINSVSKKLYKIVNNSLSAANETAHSNLHPYYVTRIWERTR